MTAPDPYLSPSEFIDSASANVAEFACDTVARLTDPIKRAIALYLAVRERVIYDPYVDLSDPASYRASGVLAPGRGFCVGKASLLAACARPVGIPARVATRTCATT